MAGIAAFTLASCDDGNEGAIYNLPESEQGYSFLTESAGASYGPGYEEETYSFKVARNFAGSEATINLTVDGANELFKVPSTVTFAAGETLADIVIGIEGMATGSSYNFTVALDSTNLSSIGETKGISVTELQFAVDYSWTKMGVCEVSDDWSEETAEIDLEYAPEYNEEGKILCRFPNMEYYLLGPKYITPGYHFQFFLAKDTFDPLGTLAVAQLMGMTNGDDGNIYWIYSPASGHTFTRENNVYTLSGYVGYDEYGPSVKAGWYYNMEFKWTEGYPFELPDEGGEEEPEEEVGNGFGAIVAGGTADNYAGTYTATFVDDGKKEKSAEVTLTKVDDNTVSMTGLFGSKYELEDTGIMLNLFGGLLYFQPDQVMGKNKYDNEVYAYSYSSETGYYYNKAMLVGGFKENGDIQFVNYSYNDENAVDGFINVFMVGENGPYLGADYIPCNVVLKAAEQAEAPAKSIKSVVESLNDARTFFDVKASNTKSFIRK